MKSIYIAGPLFNSAERSYLDHIANVLEKAGYKTFLPHRDVGVIGELTWAERSRIFYGDLEALNQHDICVALLTGPDHDSGTSAELGYCYAKGKPCTESPTTFAGSTTSSGEYARMEKTS